MKIASLSFLVLCLTAANGRSETTVESSRNEGGAFRYVDIAEIREMGKTAPKAVASAPGSSFLADVTDAFAGKIYRRLSPPQVKRPNVEPSFLTDVIDAFTGRIYRYGRPRN